MRLSYRWFTIVELLWAIVIISIALLSILSLLRVAISYTNKTRQETIAINLAREWIEWMYTRRNTNWLKRSGKKDKYRLCINTGCSERFQKDTIYKLVSTNSIWNIWKEINFEKVATYQPYWSSSPINTNNALLLWSWDFLWGISPDAAGKFYRGIVWLWLYQKDSNLAWWFPITTCPTWTDHYDPTNINWWSEISSECGDSRPKEFRFCSKVEYKKELEWKVELCWWITNYQE